MIILNNGCYLRIADKPHVFWNGIGWIIAIKMDEAMASPSIAGLSAKVDPAREYIDRMRGSLRLAIKDALRQHDCRHHNGVGVLLRVFHDQSES